MVLKKLNEDQLEQLYRLELTAVFPPDELKPLKAMLALMAGGRYEALGLYEEEALRGYALLWLEPDIPFALLVFMADDGAGLFCENGRVVRGIVIINVDGGFREHPLKIGHHLLNGLTLVVAGDEHCYFIHDIISPLLFCNVLILA